MPKPRRLNRDKVISAAVALANEAGDYRQLTLNDLAVHLDIRAPSLYNHIKSMADLYDGLTIFGVRQFKEATEMATRELVGREAIVAAAHAYRAVAHKQAGIYPLLLKAPAATNTELTELADQLVSHLRLLFGTLGLRGAEALHAVRGLRSLAHGFVALELAGGFGLPLSVDESYDRLIATFLDGLAAPSR